MQQFDSSSFMFLENYLDKNKLLEYLVVLEEICKENIERLCHYYKIETGLDSLVRSLDGINPGTIDNIEIKNLLMGHFQVEVRLKNELLDILNDNFLGYIKDILQTKKLFMHMPPMVRFILPRSPFSSVPPHQDISYNKHMGRFITAWVPLTRIDEKCGGVYFYKTKVPKELLENLETDLWLKPLDVVGLEKITYQMDLGDALLFGHHAIHESAPNTSTKIRYSIDMRFFGEDVISSKPYLDLETGTIKNYP